MNASNEPLDSSTSNPIAISPVLSLMFLLITLLFGAMLGGLLALGLASALGFEMTELLNAMTADSPRAERDIVRWINAVSHIFTFTAPPLAVAIFLYQKSWMKFFKLDRWPNFPLIVLATLFIFSAMPLAQFTFWLNKQIPLPDWATQLEGEANDMLQALLVMESPGEFLLSLFVVSVLPAIGEELLFRGFIQQKVRDLTLNSHMAVWVTAFMFSAMHMQFEGFIPRMILGAALGYLFVWTQNLWIPILAHFFNNAVQIAIPYFYADAITEEALSQATENTIPWYVVLISLGFLYFLGSQIYYYPRKESGV